MFEASKEQSYYNIGSWTTDDTVKNLEGKYAAKYDGSALDTYLNKTWYETLNEAAKSAIVESNITQYCYGYVDSTDTHASGVDYSTKAAVATLTRYIYALDVEDIEEYFGGTAGENGKNQGQYGTNQLITFFSNNSYDIVPGYGMLLLRSVWGWRDDINYAYNAWGFTGNGITMDHVETGAYVNSYGCARPAFKIDLSKISYSFYAG